MKKNTHCNFFISCLLSLLILSSGVESSLATVTLHSQVAVDAELKGYNGLADTTLFVGRLATGVKNIIDIPYRGLALLVFEKGQSYPVIIGAEKFTLDISNPATPPSFSGNDDNTIFYALLSGGTSEAQPSSFVELMIQAQQLLKSSQSIRNVQELDDKKKELLEFVSGHYQDLQHSDMVKRLIGQSFMMLEYVDYHVEGSPATDIQVRYKKEVLSCVGDWLTALREYIPDHEILNYCVSLYYDRSMVSLAYLIIANYKDAAWCPGVEKQAFTFPEKLDLISANGNKQMKLQDVKTRTTAAFVSDQCPVSMVATVSMARQLAGRKQVLLVVPLEKLSERHLGMQRMVQGETMLFLSDETWRKQNLVEELRLPLFVKIGTN